jgi:hypothetical protein
MGPDMMHPFFTANIFTILSSLFIIWMLIDCVFNRGLHGINKTFWFLFILFTNMLGALIYFFMKCTQRNPLMAFRSYYYTLNQAGRQKTPPPYQPYRYQPPAEPSYPQYEQGYRPQQPVTPPRPAQTVDAVAPPPSQAEYEEPLVSYPEIPQQQP